MKIIFGTILIFIPSLLGMGCSNKEVSADVTNEIVTGRILQSTCGGTVMELITASFNGVTWKYYTHLEGPYDPSNPIENYENCVLVGNVPLGQRITGDTLSFTYSKGLVPGNYCDIGGLPRQTISVQAIKN